MCRVIQIRICLLTEPSGGVVRKIVGPYVTRVQGSTTLVTFLFTFVAFRHMFCY